MNSILLLAQSDLSGVAIIALVALVAVIILFTGLLAVASKLCESWAGRSHRAYGLGWYASRHR